MEQVGLGIIFLKLRFGFLVLKNFGFQPIGFLENNKPINSVSFLLRFFGKNRILNYTQESYKTTYYTQF
jgi:hypothetical protein